MAGNNNPKGLGYYLYILFGIIVTFSACSVGSSTGKLGEGTLIIIIILGIYWGAPVLYQVYKEKQDRKYMEIQAAKRALERKSTYRPESQKAEAPKVQNKPQPSSASSQIHAPQQAYF